MSISICYYYERREKKGDNLPDGICRHHIISFHRMYYLGILAMCYLKLLLEEDKREVDRLGNILKAATGNNSISIIEALEDIKTDTGKFYLGQLVTGKKDEINIPRQNEELYKVVREIAWLPMNTFSGPFEKLRQDDPSQKNDGYPCGMPRKQKNALQNIQKAFENYSHSFLPHENGQGGMTQCGHFKNKADFVKLVQVFFDEIKGGWKRYESKISDWRVVTNYHDVNGSCSYQNKKNYFCFYFDQSRRRERLLKEVIDRRKIIHGNFVLKKDGWTSASRDQKVLKILSVNKETIMAKQVNYDASQEQYQGLEIKDFFGL